MNKYLYSEGAFYPYIEKALYEQAGSWPDAGVEVDEPVRNLFFVYPEGKTLGADDNGYPVWVDVPPPTHEEAVQQAEEKKQQLIDEANDFMNRKQWPGKAAIGRLKGDELAQYGLCLDYLDELEAVDTSSAPNIVWPISPAV